MQAPLLLIFSTAVPVLAGGATLIGPDSDASHATCLRRLKSVWPYAGSGIDTSRTSENVRGLVRTPATPQKPWKPRNPGAPVTVVLLT